MEVAAGDLNGNGMLEFRVTNFRNESVTLFVNQQGFFRDRNAQFVLSRPSTSVPGLGPQTLKISPQMGPPVPKRDPLLGLPRGQKSHKTDDEAFLEFLVVRMSKNGKNGHFWLFFYYFCHILDHF